MKKVLTIAALLCAASANADWFDDTKNTGSDADLYRTLYYMPKGGDLHNHLSGSNFSEWWYELALQQRGRDYNRHPGHHEMIDFGVVMTDLDGAELGELFIRLQPEHPERTDNGARAVHRL